MRPDARAELVVDALEMALLRCRPAPGLVHHSDRASQYSTLRFGARLRAARLLASMGRKGDAYHNPLGGAATGADRGRGRPAHLRRPFALNLATEPSPSAPAIRPLLSRYQVMVQPR
jgi:hypothetical protein